MKVLEGSFGGRGWGGRAKAGANWETEKGILG